jgi:lipoic acid synthetase
MDARPHIFNHNLETVARLTPLVRSRAQYQRSLTVLRKAKAMADGHVATKSGIMLGLGERREEVLQAFDDLRAHDVTVLTLGQYLRPTPKHLPVIEYMRKVSATSPADRWCAVPITPPTSARNSTCSQPSMPTSQ